MNRRSFVTGLGAVVAAPIRAEAQVAGKVWRIGYVAGRVVQKIWVPLNVLDFAPYLAHFVPKFLSHASGQVCLAREVLIRYGNRKSVRNELMANFSSEGWSGPRSVHYQMKKGRLLEFRKAETNANVKRWVDEYVEGLDREIARARIEEERRGF